ncbi:ABC transporter ATP-binding protein [Microbacterium marmarense]|uniref:ATP-binding cassette domain-containing protein n=1 Tax=Microbacterium marmarense TaxID=3122051 RepID=A0ABU8LRG8_9MICO
MMNKLADASSQSPGAADAPAVQVRGLEVSRGSTKVFDRLDLDIARGHITGLLGPSGCGKTTLMRAIVGVQKVAGGSITVLGSPAGAKNLRHRVAYDTQAASVYSDLTIEQNLKYFARLIAAPASDVDRVIEQVGLGTQRSQTIDSLSGGQESRVSLAVAMLGEPELIVLDEPTVGLDPVLRAELWQIFRGLADAGTTLIVSSHVMDEATRCDSLLLMRAGRVIADTTAQQLLSDTGTTDADAAFLALIERDAAASRSSENPAAASAPKEAEPAAPHSEGESEAPPLTRREAREQSGSEQ